MNASSDLLFRAESYVTEFLKKNLDDHRTFHNIRHTVQVVKHALQLAVLHKLSFTDTEPLLVAAWFHDVGYCFGGKDHEQHGAMLAAAFLTGAGCAHEVIDEVVRLIQSTRLPVSPATLREQIICDADMYHLGSADYPKWSVLLKEEFEFYGNAPVTDRQWNLNNIRFFKTHRYFTEHAQKNWDALKQKNLLAIELDTIV